MKKITSLLLVTLFAIYCNAQQTQKPPLHGKNWMAITGKPLAATAGSMIFQQGGNAVDAACAMLAATCTMWDVLKEIYLRNQTNSVLLEQHAYRLSDEHAPSPPHYMNPLSVTYGTNQKRLAKQALQVLDPNGK